MISRVGIVGSTDDDYDLLFYTFFGRDSAAARAWIRVRQRVWSFSVAAYIHYATYFDPFDPDAYWLRSNAWRWGLVIAMLQDMDAWWCNMIGTAQDGDYVVLGLTDYFLQCGDSDGLVPAASQEYPNFTNRYAINPITHPLYPSDSRTLTALRSTLRADFQVPLRTAGSVSRVIVSPGQLNLAPGQSGQLLGNSYDFFGTPVGVPVGPWTTTNPTVATVSSSGLVSALAEGTALVIGSADGYADTASVHVNLPSLNVSLDGPASVAPSDPCVWRAIVGGEVAPPYSFAWTINGSPVGANSDQFDGVYPISDFLLGVNVSASGVSTSATLDVHVVTSGLVEHCIAIGG